jgi:hypothetical protein
MSHESRNSTLVVFGDSLSDNGNLFDLIGQPAPPAWEGRASNGPTYAEQLAKTLHMRLDDRAFAAAEASDASPPVLVDRAGHALPINLSNQLAGYIADLNGHQAPHHTTALINIGSNDYQGFLQSNLPKNAQTIQAGECREVSRRPSTRSRMGVEKLSCSHYRIWHHASGGKGPGGRALTPDDHNAASRRYRQPPNVVGRHLSASVAPSPSAQFWLFGKFEPDLLASSRPAHQFAPNEVALDGIHPTTSARDRAAFRAPC